MLVQMQEVASNNNISKGNPLSDQVSAGQEIVIEGCACLLELSLCLFNSLREDLLQYITLS